jgi:hypothetical protein
MEGKVMRKKVYTRQVGVLFSEDTYQELIRITDEIEISVSEFIRSIVEERINQRKREDKYND